MSNLVNQQIIKLSTTEVIVPDPCDRELQSQLWDRMPSLEKRLPDGVDPAQWVTLALAATNEAFRAGEREATKKGCVLSVNSLIKCIFNAAVIGLDLGDKLALMHIVPVPRGRKGDPNHRIECQLWTGYRGYMELGRSNRWVDVIETNIVLNSEHENGDFDQWTDIHGKQFKHSHNTPLNSKVDMREVYGSYCVAQSPSASKPQYEFVWGAELRELYKRGNVWHSHPIQQCRKTPIRRIAESSWPRRNKSLLLALEMDRQMDAEEAQTDLVPTESGSHVSPKTIEAATSEPPKWVGELNRALGEADRNFRSIEAIRKRFKNRKTTDSEQVDSLVDAFLQAAGITKDEPATEAPEDPPEAPVQKFDADEMLTRFRERVSKCKKARSTLTILNQFRDLHGEQCDNLDDLLSPIVEEHLGELCKTELAELSELDDINKAVSAWCKQVPRMKTAIETLGSLRIAALASPEPKTISDTPSEPPASQDAPQPPDGCPALISEVTPELIQALCSDLEKLEAAVKWYLGFAEDEAGVEAVEGGFIPHVDSDVLDHVYDLTDAKREEL